MAIKSMSDSYVFNMINKNNIVNNNVLKSITNGAILDLEKDLPEAAMLINRNFRYPMKLRVLELLQQGKIVLKFSPKDIKIPSSVPFVLYKDTQGHIKAIVFTDIYTSQLADGTYKTDAKKLYTMMEASAIALGYMQNYRGLSNNVTVISAGADIFSSMVLRVLNKKYSLIDKNKINSVLFLASKFYMLSVLGLQDSEQINNYAKKNLRNANPLLIDNINETMSAEDYKDISTFIKALANDEKNNLGMEQLTVRGFIEAFINMYDSASILSLELFPYFIYNVISVLNSAYINNQYIMEDMVIGSGKGPQLYNSLREYI